MRLRRSCLAVPGSNPKMLAKAATLPADMVFLDLEDAVAPLEKNDATRQHVVDALTGHEWTAPTRVVRVNDVVDRVVLPRHPATRRGRAGRARLPHGPEGPGARQVHSSITC